MNGLSLIGPTGKPMVALGGINAWKQRTIRGIVCSFQWLDLRGHGFENTLEHSNVACMCLFRPGSMGQGAYIVPQINAFLFGDRNGNPLPFLRDTADNALEQMGFDRNDRHAWKAIIDIIIEGLPDLIWMPSEAPEGSDAVGVKAPVKGIEARATMNGKVIHEEVL